jgi:tight adherence protein B
MILFIAFVVMLTISFAVMAVLSGSSQSEKVAEKRLATITAPKAGAGANQVQMQEILKVNPDNKFGWLDDILQKYPIAHKLEARIVQSDSKMTVGTLLATSVGMAVVGFIVACLIFSMFAIQVLVACVVGYIPFVVISIKRSRRMAAFNAGLPDAIDMMGRALRAGHSMVASINTVAEQSAEPVKTEFREVFKQQNFGMPLRDALNQMLDHVPSQDLKVLVTGILVQKETGGNLAEILDRTASVIRERLRIQGEIRTHTAQGRMTGWILCSLPIVMLFMINFINPGYSNILIYTPIGHKLIYLGAGLLFTGAMAIRQIINGIEV